MATKSVRFPVSSLRPPPPNINPSILSPSSVQLNTKIGPYFRIGYQFSWPALGSNASTLYIKYRIVESQGPGVSMWSVPIAYRQPFFDVYQRQVASVYDPGAAPRSWQKIVTVVDNVTPVLAAVWSGSVQYCIALSHPENTPAPEEGLSLSNTTIADVSTINNKYVCYISNPLPTVAV